MEVLFDQGPVDVTYIIDEPYFKIRDLMANIFNYSEYTLKERISAFHFSDEGNDHIVKITKRSFNNERPGGSSYAYYIGLSNVFAFLSSLTTKTKYLPNVMNYAREIHYEFGELYEVLLNGKEKNDT